MKTKKKEEIKSYSDLLFEKDTEIKRLKEGILMAKDVPKAAFFVKQILQENQKLKKELKAYKSHTFICEKCGIAQQSPLGWREECWMNRFDKLEKEKKELEKNYRTFHKLNKSGVKK